jgi:alpha-D-ribose 1-methylphosphonate 5-triphosphate synthase subunit PhnH
LVDHECSVYTEDPVLAEALRHTGAKLVPLELADHAFLSLQNEQALARLANISTGNLLYPDNGATVIAPAKIGDGPELKLTGPGIETEKRIRLAGVHPGLWSLRAQLCTYPLGIEFIFIGGADIIGIPRSTVIEEL